MKSFAKLAASTLAAALFLSGCSTSTNTTKDAPAKDAKTAESKQEANTFPVKVKHSSGETEIKAEPKRIVVLDMGVLDTIDAIGAGDKVVGVPTKSVPTWLKDNEGIDYSKAENVGTLKEPDFEAIAKLKPDLVLIGGRTAKLYDEVAKNFPTVNIKADWNADTYVADVVNNVKVVGQALGKNEAAKAAAKKIDDAVAKYQNAAKDKGSAMVLMTNAGEVSMHGVKSRWAPIWSVFGFSELRDTNADEGHKGAKISFETIKELNPDYIFAVDRDAAVGKVDPGVTAEKVLDNEFVNATPAAKNKHITYLTPERWYIVMTGANNFLAMLDEVNAALK
ncbi:siderophore ABC transporter substrate-binding protein [Arcanobacterium hippocoleae]|uniref:Iron complex transport system substrate-binding protein n=1 Tax=Arcanobacterium hippocoleae TaxID=149017 RepID=A0ABU1T327_9ACTO|nr:ABC transporter substrate-binding protein [Arcanobacterium hippocoleae]MDR6939789.1 iron complex transport system substrate-binding protein [Arcanobacterium hippocoleae]